MIKSGILLITASLAVAISAISCGRRVNPPEALTTKIQYDVPILSNDPQLDWWINNIEGSRREPFLKRIMDAAIKGEVRTYDYFLNPLTAGQVKASLSDTVFQTLVRRVPPYEEYDTMIIKTVEYREINKIRFLEEWTWDQGHLSINKRVIGFGPVIQREVSGENFNQLLFWILQ